MSGDILEPGEATRMLEEKLAEMRVDVDPEDGTYTEEEIRHYLGDSEVLVVNKDTGGQKCSKDIQMSYLPVDELKEVLRLYHEGAKKYAKGNWMLGYDWSLSYDALQRHAMDFWNGESEHEVISGDQSTRCKHLASVIFHAFALMYFENNHPELDDRPSTKTKSI